MAYFLFFFFIYFILFISLDTTLCLSLVAASGGVEINSFLPEVKFISLSPGPN